MNLLRKPFYKLIITDCVSNIGPNIGVGCVFPLFSAQQLTVPGDGRQVEGTWSVTLKQPDGDLFVGLQSSSRLGGFCMMHEGLHLVLSLSRMLEYFGCISN